MTPGLLNLSIRSGDTYLQTLTISSASEADPTTPGSAIDLTGCMAEMDIVSTYDVAPVYSLSSAAPTGNGGSITLGGVDGTITISIPPADTMTLSQGQYDLKVRFADGSILTFVAGNVFVTDEVTKWA
jgi:hypothetical protein